MDIDRAVVDGVHDERPTEEEVEERTFVRAIVFVVVVGKWQTFWLERKEESG